MIASQNPNFPVPGTEVGCEYRWPFHANHPDCWQPPIRGVVLNLDDPRAWCNSLAFPRNPPTQEECTAHVQKCLAQGLLNESVPVLWSWGSEKGIQWDRKLRPYAEELAAWEAARTAALGGNVLKHWLRMPAPGQFRGEGTWVSVDKAVYDSYPEGVIPKHIGELPPEDKATSDDVKREWSAAETRAGKYVCLDQDTLNSLIGVPKSILTEEVRSLLSRS